MTEPTILIATWQDGLLVLAGASSRHELPGRSVCGLTYDGRAGALAIVDGHSVCRRDRTGQWSTIANHDTTLACCMTVADTVYVGTDDARVLRVGDDGSLTELRGFDSVPGRDTWYAGSALIDGQVVGPPLGIRSLAANANGTLLFANVHVGGIPRSIDGGATWQPTIDVDSDVHEVQAHPTDPDVIVAAAAVGLCISRDGGATWSIERDGLHAAYCSAVAFSHDEILVAASEHHFAPRGAVYRRSRDGPASLTPVGAGLPIWTDGIVDTGCIAASESGVAIADKGGNLYVRPSATQAWLHQVAPFRSPSGVLIV